MGEPHPGAEQYLDDNMLHHVHRHIFLHDDEYASWNSCGRRGTDC